MVLQTMRRPKITLAELGGMVTGMVSDSAAHRLMAAAGVRIDHAAAQRIGVATLRVRGARTQLETYNVIGELPGRGALARERVVLGAHYDHLGIGPAVRGDSIYNGARDNASGTATMLATAEAFATSGVRTRRRLTFVAFGAEEAGMLGSRAFVSRAGAPTLAMLNFDGANLFGATRDATSLGGERSTLGAAFSRAVRAEGMVSVAPQYDEGDDLLQRSDQLSFLMAGTPALFLRYGHDLVAHGAAYADSAMKEYESSRYHQPSDELLPTYVFDGAAQQARIAARILVEVGDASERPRWIAR